MVCDVRHQAVITVLSRLCST